MQNLLIEQKGPAGLIKTWRLTEDQGTLTFGNSKHADLRSPIDSVKGIQGMFEYRSGKWYYVNLDLHTDHAELKNGHTDICLDQPLEFNLGVSQLSITPFDSRAELFAQFDEKTDLITPQTNKKPYQLFTVYQGSKLVQTAVIEPHQTFTSEYDIQKTKLTPIKSEKWIKTPVGELDINQRTVYLSSVDALKMMTKDQVVDEGGKKTLFATLAGAALLALLFIFSPKTDEVVEIAAPPIEFREVTPPPLKKKALSDPAPKTEEIQPQQVAAPKPTETATPQPAKAQAGGSSKAASAIKSLASGRITQLIGKVSAAAARSNNVVVTSGIAAGTAPSGRALAAVGAISQSGKDWTSEGKGTGVKISTNGIAGGQGVAGMGTLAAGTTGTGGVGLLEDEGEITGGLDREVIAQYIKSKLGEILYCYERQLSANPELFGKVAVRFSIGGNGAVETQRIGDSTLRNAMVEGCILQKVANWKFPVPEGGTKVLVTYPFLFKSTN